MKYSAVAFDVDGTLYPDSALRLKAVLPMLAHPLFLLAFAKVRETLHGESALPDDSPGLPKDLASFRAHQADLLATALHVSAGAALARIDEIVYRGIPTLFKSVRPFAGVGECLGRLKSAGLTLVALSDFPCEEKLVHLGLDGYFSKALTSESSGRLKPSRKSFLDLAAGLGLGPSQILYVGNSPRYDIGGARAAGMDSALVLGRGGPHVSSAGQGAGPSLAFSNWKDLEAFVLA